MEPDQLVSMSAEDYPRIIPFPIFPAPGILCGRAPDDRISPKVLFCLNKEDEKSVLKLAQEGSLAPIKVSPASFAKMLVKTGQVSSNGDGGGSETEFCLRTLSPRLTARGN